MTETVPGHDRDTNTLKNDRDRDQDFDRDFDQDRGRDRDRDRECDREFYADSNGVVSFLYPF